MKKLFITLLALSLTTAATAAPWHNLGPRAMGMGGAHVAIAQGPAAAYWNPAGLGQLYNESGFTFEAGARGAFAGAILEGANDLHDIMARCQSGAGGICNSTAITAALSKFGQPNNGALAEIGGLTALKIGRVVVFVDNMTVVGATPEVDVTRTGACSGALCIDNNASRLILRGGSFTGIGVGYGREIMESGLVLGANIKGIAARIGYDELALNGEDPGQGAFSNFKDNTASSFQPAVDVGALWDIRETFPSVPLRPRVGITGRNLNNPKFKQPALATAGGDRSKFSLDGQVRAGAALSPFKFWHLAADIDITDNKTAIDGFRSRMLGLGTEINLVNSPRFNLPVRAGLQKNISKAGNSSLAYTAGIGLNFLHFMVDLGGSMASESTTVQSESEFRKLPNNFSGALRIAVLFGHKDEGVRNK
jgi:hypothetical protein